MSEWFAISGSQFLGIVLSAISIYVILMVMIKINGLRSFSKMSGHDFAITVAIGSILASTVVSDTPSVIQGALAIGTLLGFQSILSLWRIKRVKKYLENEPLLLMRNDHIYEDNLKKAKITKGDLIAKLREANVLHLNEVRAVVLEQTGDISVLHGEKDLESQLLHGVRTHPSDERKEPENGQI
jgi:uncharacterized membrane protein YcaP (DUF421 family)